MLQVQLLGELLGELRAVIGEVFGSVLEETIRLVHQRILRRARLRMGAWIFSGGVLKSEVLI